MDYAKRQNKIDQIKALLSKTRENGATEAETMSAFDKAAAMMDAYEISDEEVQDTKDEVAMEHADPPDLADEHNIKWHLTYAVGNFCNVQIYRMQHETAFRCIGLRSDVEFAIWMLEHLADFVFDELYQHLIGCCAPRSERRLIKRTFVEACCGRINQRLNEFHERSKVARTSNGRELVQVKDAAIKAFMTEHKIKLRTSSSSCSSNVNAAAAAAGKSAGDRANFGKPVSGVGAVLRLGNSPEKNNNDNAN